jgi:hypothetical protein
MRRDLEWLVSTSSIPISQFWRFLVDGIRGTRWWNSVSRAASTNLSRKAPKR